jgi:hypothetical protein
MKLREEPMLEDVIDGTKVRASVSLAYEERQYRMQIMLLYQSEAELYEFRCSAHSGQCTTIPPGREPSALMQKFVGKYLHRFNTAPQYRMFVPALEMITDQHLKL